MKRFDANMVRQIKTVKMNNSCSMIYLIVLLSLNFSCIEKKTTEKEIDKSDLVKTSKADTLKFTSGIRSIFQDSRGNYWFGSHREGVCRFDGKSFQYFTTNEGLTDNHVYSIQEGKNGIIWFNTQKGVSSYDGNTIKNHIQTENKASQNAWLKTGNGVSQGEWVKSANDLWFSAGIKEGVYRYDGQKINYLAFPNPIADHTNNVYAVTGFSKGRSNMLWMCTYGGVFGYNGKQLTVINDETLGFKKETTKLHVRSIFEDSKGRLWIGNNGIGVLLKFADSTINFSEKHNLIHPSSKRMGDKSPPNTLEHVFEIQEDSEGNIWFGDRDTGAWKFNGKKIVNYTVDEKLNSQMIWEIYEDQNKNLLFGMAAGGVYKFNGKTFEKYF